MKFTMFNRKSLFGIVAAISLIIALLGSGPDGRAQSQPEVTPASFEGHWANEGISGDHPEGNISMVTENEDGTFSGSDVINMPGQDQPIGTAGQGDIAIAFVGSFTGARGLDGYVTYIAGYDGPMFSSEMIRNETTAYFTLHQDPAMGPPRGSFSRGRELTNNTLPLRFRLYFDETPDGDFAQPETFADGMLIADYEDLGVHFVQDTRDGYALVRTFSRTQVLAGSFTFAGSSYTFGQEGNRVRMDNVFITNPDNPMLNDVSGVFIQLSSEN